MLTLCFRAQNKSPAISSLVVSNDDNPTNKFVKYRKHRKRAVFAAINDVTRLRSVIENGANINITNKKGYTPLMVAAQLDSLECLQLLLDNRARIDTVNVKNGDTTLMCAIRANRPDHAKLLIQHGANVHIKNKQEKAAIHCALDSFVEHLNIKFFAYLKDHENCANGIIKAIEKFSKLENNSITDLITFDNLNNDDEVELHLIHIGKKEDYFVNAFANGSLEQFKEYSSIQEPGHIKSFLHDSEITVVISGRKLGDLRSRIKAQLRELESENAPNTLEYRSNFMSIKPNSGHL